MIRGGRYDTHLLMWSISLIRISQALEQKRVEYSSIYNAQALT